MTKLAPLAGLAVLALGLGACGGSSSSSSSAAPASSSSASSTPPSSSAAAPAPAGSSASASVAADPSGQLAFTAKTLTATAGTVKIHFANRSPVPHNLTLQRGAGGAVVSATPTFAHGDQTLTVKLTPGTYTFFCSVPGHRMAGMQGILTVH